ncbi:FCD domain-containing protein [Enterovibrio sp. ZSDZ35]|uniref:FCD domain-containing protein n=1 Tax=Enterovibrio qingdaonensis TaxID=2899818 RepID=A0ABT5QHZ0_9GAMM|nr:FCD domain-containing protein [Enterovibrio sp. ZSDZ35]MDD1780609.1 FCD domain-containing protein [Enterovibrio sp. ZSDZ35]
MSNVTRLYQKIGTKIMEQIAAGEYKVGDKLPPERDIAEQLQVSRSVIREALIMLEIKELVEVKKGSGVYVINTPSTFLNQASLQPTEKVTGQSESDEDDAGPFEMLQARQLLESHIAEFAATQVTKHEIFRLREALELERKDLEAGSNDYDGDQMFHIVIAEATQNSVLSDMVKDMWERRNRSLMWQQLHERISDQDYRKRWLADHERIFKALVRKDPVAAREAMWQHLENVKQTLFELSDVDDPSFDGYLFSSYPVTLSQSE